MFPQSDLPKLLTKRKGKYCEFQFSNFTLANNKKDRWFLSKDNEIVALQSAYCNGADIVFRGTKIHQQSNFFTLPFSSSRLNIYQANLIFDDKERTFPIADVQCKMVGLKSLNESFVFMPLLHTM